MLKQNNTTTKHLKTNNIMKVKNLIKQLEQYNQEADVFVNSNFKDIGFTIAYNRGDGVEKENCETVSIYPDNLGAENTNNCTSFVNPKECGARLGVDSSSTNVGYESMQERSYSEEEVLDILKELEIECVINPRRTEIREWFEQFKKK